MYLDIAIVQVLHPANKILQQWEFELPIELVLGTVQQFFKTHTRTVLTRFYNMLVHILIFDQLGPENKTIFA